MGHIALQEAALAAIAAVFRDTSVSREQTRSSLEDLREAIDEKLETLKLDTEDPDDG